MKFEQLSKEEKTQFKNGIIQVNGKAMNRSALGIIAAYFKLYPKTTFIELKEAFPDSLNPSGPHAPRTIFKPYTDRDFGVVHSLEEIKKEFGEADLPYEGAFFTKEDEMFKTSDGIIVIVNRLWQSQDGETGQNDLEVLAKRAIEYGIVLNKFEARTPFARGTYSLDILAPTLFNKMIAEPEPIKEKTKYVTRSWFWIVLGFVTILILLWVFGVF